MALLRFDSHYQTRVWGSQRLAQQLGRQLPDAQPYGEAWELVDRPEAQSTVLAGQYTGLSLHELWVMHRTAIFGSMWAQHPAERFPLLIKILDCADDLSIQVHPPASVAAELGGEPKTEMWYIASADPGAQIYAGLKRGVTRPAFEQALADGTVAECVHTLPAQRGDSLFVPSGRLHALGKGLLIYEIQQNSDTTYRVFDWNRMGLDGKLRSLHIQESLRSIDFTDYEPRLLCSAQATQLAVCDSFTVQRARTGDNCPTRDNCRIIMTLQPTVWHGETFPPGCVLLQPAHSAPAAPDGEWLEIELGKI